MLEETDIKEIYQKYFALTSGPFFTCLVVSMIGALIWLAYLIPGVTLWLTAGGLGCATLLLFMLAPTGIHALCSAKSSRTKIENFKIVAPLVTITNLLIFATFFTVLIFAFSNPFTATLGIGTIMSATPFLTANVGIGAMLAATIMSSAVAFICTAAVGVGRLMHEGVKKLRAKPSNPPLLPSYQETITMRANPIEPLTPNPGQKKDVKIPTDQLPSYRTAVATEVNPTISYPTVHAVNVAQADEQNLELPPPYPSQ